MRNFMKIMEGVVRFIHFIILLRELIFLKSGIKWSDDLEKDRNKTSEDSTAHKEGFRIQMLNVYNSARNVELILYDDPNQDLIDIYWKLYCEEVVIPVRAIKIL